MAMRLTNSMDVILAIVGIVIVDDKLDIIDVKAPGGDVSGDEDGGAASLELAQHPLPLLLLFVTMDAHCWPTVFPHQPLQNNMSSQNLNYTLPPFCEMSKGKLTFIRTIM